MDEEGLDCASSLPDWKPNTNWQPEFEETLNVEAYDGN